MMDTEAVSIDGATGKVFLGGVLTTECESAAAHRPAATAPLEQATSPATKEPA